MGEELLEIGFFGGGPFREKILPHTPTSKAFTRGISQIDLLLLYAIPNNSSRKFLGTTTPKTPQD